MKGPTHYVHGFLLSKSLILVCPHFYFQHPSNPNLHLLVNQPIGHNVFSLD